jgi:hypothetical protein
VLQILAHQLGHALRAFANVAEKDVGIPEVVRSGDAESLAVMISYVPVPFSWATSTFVAPSTSYRAKANVRIACKCGYERTMTGREFWAMFKGADRVWLHDAAERLRCKRCGRQSPKITPYAD